MKAVEIICLIAVSLAGVCYGQGVADNNSASIAQGNNKFAVELYEKLRTQQGNLFFSPYSISTALAMAYAGAKGQTQSQMADVLNFEKDSNTVHLQLGQIIKDLNERGKKGSYALAVANAIWGQKGYSILKEYLGLLETSYGGGFYEVDFITASEQARETINKWVEEKTRDKIKDLLAKGMVNSDTRMVLTNAIYFKGKWKSQFKKERTKDEPFKTGQGQSEIPMMKQTEAFGYMETESFQALEMPYVNEELSMIIFLPKEIDGIADLEQNLSYENLIKWISEMRKQQVIISVPRFKMTEKFSLAETLKSMGMADAFIPDKADFSGISGNRELYISAVVHKAFVDVNEEGTEAAAATGIGMKATSAGPSRTPVFKADHPFIFLIKDNESQSILFFGRVVKPE